MAKQCAGEHIIEAIKTVSNGKQYFSANITNRITAIANNNIKNGISQEGAFLGLLTDREIEVLKLIAQEFNSKEIAGELFISVNTVESHRKNLIRKLNVKNAVGLALFAHKNYLV